jgi:hypothetical protein
MSLWQVFEADDILVPPPPEHGSADVKITCFDHYEGTWWDGGGVPGGLHPTNMGIYTPIDDKSGTILLYEERAYQDIDPWYPCNSLVDRLVWQIELPAEALLTVGKIVADMEIINFGDVVGGCSGLGYGQAPNGGVGQGSFIQAYPHPSNTESCFASGTSVWGDGRPGFALPPFDDAISLYGSMYQPSGAPAFFFLGDNVYTGPSRATNIGTTGAYMAIGSLARWYILQVTSDYRDADITYILHSLKWVW